MRRAYAMGVSLGLVVACTDPPTPTTPSTATTSPAQTSTQTEPQASASTPATDAGPDTPPPAPVSAAVALLGGLDLPLLRDFPTTVDPSATFRVEVAAHLRDGRLALLDEADAMVVSTGTTELGPSFTRYQLSPAEPLRPGSRYDLRLEGDLSRELHDGDGKAYGPLLLELRTSGERPAAPARKRRKGRP